MRLIAALCVCSLGLHAQPPEIPFANAQRNAVSQSLPTYPPLAKVAKISGTVQFKLTIDFQGQVKTEELLSGHPLLVPSADEVLKNWRYRPFLSGDGTPREITTRVGIKFDAAKVTVTLVEVSSSQQESVDQRGAINGTEATMSGTGQPYSVTAKILHDRLKSFKLPDYPLAAEAEKIEGTVRLTLTVDRAGKVTGVSVMDGPPELAAAAAENARTRVYAPFLRNGSAVAVTGDAYLTFTLNPDAQMPVFPGDDIDALLNAATTTARGPKIEATEKYCFEAIRRAHASKEDRSSSVHDALGILYQVYARAANADPSKSEELHKRLTAITAEQEQPNGYWTAQAMFALGGDFLAGGRFQDAGEQYVRAIALVEPCVDLPETRFCSMLLGDALGYQAVALYAQGKIAESLPFFERAVVRPDDAIHEETKVVALSIYSQALAQSGRTAEATETARRLQEFQQTHPDAAKKAGMVR